MSWTLCTQRFDHLLEVEYVQRTSLTDSWPCIPVAGSHVGEVSPHAGYCNSNKNRGTPRLHTGTTYYPHRSTTRSSSAPATNSRRNLSCPPDAPSTSRISPSAELSATPTIGPRGDQDPATPYKLRILSCCRRRWRSGSEEHESRPSKTLDVWVWWFELPR